MEDDLLAFPVGRDVECAFVGTYGTVFHGNQWRVALDAVAGTYIERMAIAFHFPVGRHFDVAPSAYIVAFFKEVHRALVRTGNKLKLPGTVQRLKIFRLTLVVLHCFLFGGVGHEGGGRRQTVDVQHIKVFPIVVRVRIFVGSYGGFRFLGVARLVHGCTVVLCKCA